jgi:hypothetical protein
MITHTPVVAGNLPIKTLVGRRWPTNGDTPDDTPGDTHDTSIIFQNNPTTLRGTRSRACLSIDLPKFLENPGGGLLTKHNSKFT